MRIDQLPESLTRLVTPRAVCVYAEGMGWSRVEGVNGKIAVYQNPKAPLRQLIVPRDERLDDYGLRAAEAIERLAEFEQRPAKEILNHLLLPPADILSFREAMTAPALLPEFKGNVVAVQTAPGRLAAADGGGCCRRGPCHKGPCHYRRAGEGTLSIPLIGPGTSRGLGGVPG